MVAMSRSGIEAWVPEIGMRTSPISSMDVNLPWVSTMISTSLTSILPPGSRMFCCPQTFPDICGIDSQLRNLGAGHLEIDALILHTGEIDLLDALHHVEALSDLTGGFMHFGHAESIAPKRDGGHRRIAESVVDHRSDGAFRQLGFDITPSGCAAVSMSPGALRRALHL